MYCANCGTEDSQANQFCRSCGSDLLSVRNALLRPDRVTESAALARDEIGRAIAAKIREVRTASELSTVAEEVLPEVEKFLESPQEKRLRRMRVGTILSSIGLGAAVGISIVSQFMGDADVIFLAALGLVCFFLGLGFILNGVFLTVPRKAVQYGASNAGSQQALDEESSTTAAELAVSEANSLFPSVTEHTTRQLERDRK